MIARERKFAGLDLAEVQEDGTFSGYASVFGRVDLGRDVVERGAFADSIIRRGPAGVRMLFQHDPGQPIGSWQEIREDARGLFVVGKLTTGVARAREVLELMRSRAIDGLSVGFRTIHSTKDARTGIRHIRKADLWEISVVTFPMNPEARIEQVRGIRTGGRTANHQGIRALAPAGCGADPKRGPDSDCKRASLISSASGTPRKASRFNWRRRSAGRQGCSNSERMS